MATESVQQGSELEFHAGTRSTEQPGFSPRTVFWILASAACYYLATRAAWVLCFPDSKVSLFFFPHAILVSILLLVPTRQWWAYVLAAACTHFLATQQENWAPTYALQCEAFDAVKTVLLAAGIRFFIKSPFHRITLREAIIFVLITVVIVPFGTAFWGAAFTVSNHFGTQYWVEWRNLGVSNGVTGLVLVPVVLLGVHSFQAKRFNRAPTRIAEACLLALGTLVVGYLGFDRLSAGPNTPPALLYAPIPLLIWATLRFGRGGMSASMLFITSLAIWGTMHGRGPFLTQTPAENALALQLFILTATTPLMLLAVAIDDERRSKDALRVSEERMSLAVESAQLALWDWDVVNDTVWIKNEGRILFGFAPEEPLHYASVAERVHPDDRAVRAAAIQHTLKTGDPYQGEHRIILPDGSVRWIVARGRRASPVMNDTPPRVLGVSMDVTRQKQADAEAQLQREQLAHLSRAAALSALSGSLAHELSQPLSSIIMYAEAGQRFMSQNPPNVAEIRTVFAEIASAHRRAGEIIERQRTLLRGGQVARRAVSVNECLEELLCLTRNDLIGRRVTVSNLTPADLPPAMTDRVQLQQVLLNLIVNACDAMKTIPPEDRKLTLTTFIEQNEMRIGVLDCGVGLPDDVETVFQPFYTTKESGLGMGLSICRTLITALDGRLWAEHRAEGGAAFYVALPLAKKNA
ncbi:MAG: MASE1 domain-containing protein [Povalibacter sp.]